MNLVWLNLLVLLAAPAASFAAASRISLGPNIWLTVAEGIPAEQGNTLAKDIAFLKTLTLHEDPELQQAIGTDEPLTAELLTSWLAEPEQYVVGEDIDTRRSSFPLAVNYPYENPGVQTLDQPPGIVLPPGNPPSPQTESSPVTVMSNLGASLYSAGKKTRVLVGLKVPGVGMVPLTTARVGVIRIGAGMFQPIFRRKGFADTNSKFYALFRLGTLFHEARHSDGNGESLGFSHTYCPIGHDYEGSASCDLSLNGAYTLGGLFERVLTEACTGCSTAEREMLRLDVADSFNRVLPEGPRYPAAANWLVACQRAARDHWVLDSAVQAGCERLLLQPVEKVKSSEWDEQPEGSRNAGYMPTSSWINFGWPFFPSLHMEALP